jgi:hypothetical protein
MRRRRDAHEMARSTVQQHPGMSRSIHFKMWGAMRALIGLIVKLASESKR